MTERIPLEVLFGNPERVLPRLSPDGRMLAYLAPDEGVMNVWVGDGDGANARPVTTDRGRGIQTYQWAEDGRHLLFVQDTDGDENWHLHTVDVHTHEVVDRTPAPGAQATVLGVSRRVPGSVVVGLNDRDPRVHDVYRLDLESGVLRKEFENPGFDTWLVDLDLEVRGGIRTRSDGGLEYAFRQGDGDPAEWPVRLAVEPDDATLNTSGTIGFDGKGQKLYLLSPIGSDTSRIVRFDPEVGSHEVVFEDPEHDVAGVVIDKDTGEPQFAYVARARTEIEVLDPSLLADVEQLRGLDRGDLQIVDRDRAGDVWIVGYLRDDGPIRYAVYDRRSGALTDLFDHQPSLNQYQLASMEPFSFEARDGLTIHGYVTAPAGVERSHLPTVIHVHGGPWGARHAWGYNPNAHWLADRGYLCLEINYRGSGGYGKAFLNASAREWAAKMHDDLLDGLQHAVDQGWADPDRVAIFGGSYGGYAALVGATFTPEVFRCAVDYVGPSNLITLLESLPPYWVGVRQVFYRLLGHPERDRDFLWSRSPLSRVDNITIPLFIAQGANDPRVKQAESEQLVEAMKERGIDHEYLLFADEGHGFVKPENRLEFYRRVEEFLARHL